jgi:hypothetical protein
MIPIPLDRAVSLAEHGTRPVRACTDRCRAAPWIPAGRAHTGPRRPPARRPGERGVSEVLGFILLFGVLILGVTMVQLYGVPATNERLEFEHSQRALGDVAEVNDLFGQVTTTGQPGSATIDAGLLYPSRLFLFNPAPVSGALRTTNRGTVTVANAIVPGSTLDDVRDYWNGEARTFETSSLSYEASYNLYDFAPTRAIEHGLVYDRFPDGGMLTRNRAPLIEGNRITIVTLDSDIDTATAGSIIVESALRSGLGETVTVTNTDGNDLRLTVPTGLSVDEMKTALAHEYPDGSVADVVDGPAGSVTVVLEPGTYELSMSNVKVGSQASGAQRAHYLVPVTSAPVTVQEGSRTTLTVQVRDRLNNPVSGVTVEANGTLPGGTLAPLSGESDGEGLVTFAYAAQDQVTGSAQLADEVQLTLGDRSALGAGFDPRTVENATVGLLLQNTDGSGMPDTGPGVGGGGLTDWDEETNQTFSVANGKWLSIDEIEAIELSDAEHVVRQFCTGTSGNPHDDCRFVDEFRLTFTLWSGPDAYGVDVQLLDTNRDGDFDDTYNPANDEWDERRHVTVTDANTNTVFFERALRPSAITALRGSGVDILGYAGTYEGGTGIGGQSQLDRLKLVDATWFTGTVHGRVHVEIPPP